MCIFHHGHKFLHDFSNLSFKRQPLKTSQNVLFNHLVYFVARTGQISAQEFMTFMISRETENVDSAQEVEEAFQAITAGGERPYVTKEELYQVHYIQV